MLLHINALTLFYYKIVLSVVPYKLAFILSALILAVLFNMCFVYGCWYFNAKSVLEVIVFIIGLIVLRRDTLRSSALMGTISIVLAVLLDMVIPFHFG